MYSIGPSSLRRQYTIVYSTTTDNYSGISMNAHSEWKQGDIFEASTENGNTVKFDADSAHAHGPSPMEAVLMALCSCTSVDVVSILKKKRQPLTGLRVTAVATQADGPPRVFTRILLT